ncbi:MAG: disulfide bond formation protein B [Holosporales bacterium]|jgi:disulfide bond formation protein DsbB
MHSRFLLLFAAAAGALAVAFALQYLGGFAPCTLCVWQRWPYVLVILVALWANRSLKPWAFFVCSGLFASAALLAGYHAGVEQGWWTFASSCTGTIQAVTVEALEAALAAAPLTRCDQPSVVVLGLSLSVWNGLYAGVWAVVSVGWGILYAKPAARR